MKKCNIKILVCCHKEAELPGHELLVPIQVGTALAGEEFPGYLHDNTGDHISEKNKRYCELTALYWAHKNLQADYYGLFHYRRFLYPDLETKRPYRVVCHWDLKYLDYGDFSHTIEQYDMVLPKRENMYVSVRQHYADALFQHKKDLDLVETIVRRRSPEMVSAMEEYFSGMQHYFGNICIMKSDLFHEYCRWLFPVLEEFDREADVSGYGKQEMRVDGYLAERLLGVYVTYLRGSKRVLELPRLHLMPRQGFAARALLWAFPPSSYRRYLLKKVSRIVRRK